MSETPLGDGWWIASDGKWYPPHLHPDAIEAGAMSDDPTAPGPGFWLASDGQYYPPELHPDELAGKEPSGDNMSEEPRGPSRGLQPMAGVPGGWRFGIGGRTEGVVLPEHLAASRAQEEFLPGGLPPGARRQRARGPHSARMRILAALAVVVVLLGLVGGAVVAAVTRSPAPTRAEDGAAARRIALRRSDVPQGWQALSPSRLTLTIPSNQRLGGSHPDVCQRSANARATVLARLERLAATETSGFESTGASSGSGSGSESLVGKVAVFASFKDGATYFRDLVRDDSPSLLACSGALAAGSSMHLGDTVVRRLILPLIGTDVASSALTVSTNLFLLGSSLQVQIALVVAHVGRAVMVVLNYAIGASANLVALTSATQKMADRAEALVG